MKAILDRLRCKFFSVREENGYATFHKNGVEFGRLTIDKYWPHLELTSAFPLYNSWIVKLCADDTGITYVTKLSPVLSDELAEVCSELEFLVAEICEFSTNDLANRLSDLLHKLENLQ